MQPACCPQYAVYCISIMSKPERVIVMAEGKHRAVLLEGVRNWNTWRAEHPDIKPDLRGLNLREEEFRGPRGRFYFDFDTALADYDGFDFSNTNLKFADLSFCRFKDADFTNALLQEAKCSNSDFSSCCFYSAKLNRTDFTDSKMDSASLEMSTLSQTILESVSLMRTDFSNSRLFRTVFGYVDMSQVIGLSSARFQLRCLVDLITVRLSETDRDIFLKGAGYPDWAIEVNRLAEPTNTDSNNADVGNDLVQKRIGQPIQIADLFLSHSHGDSAAVDAIQDELNSRGIRSWRYTHDATSGPLERVVFDAMANRIVLLVLSENSVESDWVEYEARLARQFAKDQRRNVLCPIALDNAWKTCSWPERLRTQIEEYTILDFSSWENRTSFHAEIDRLIAGLGIYYKTNSANNIN